LIGHHLLCRLLPCPDQGDQIGRIFVDWANFPQLGEFVSIISFPRLGGIHRLGEFSSIKRIFSEFSANFQRIFSEFSSIGRIFIDWANFHRLDEFWSIERILVDWVQFSSIGRVFIDWTSFRRLGEFSPLGDCLR
jgi:hypothetical protein